MHFLIKMAIDWGLLGHPYWDSLVRGGPTASTSTRPMTSKRWSRSHQIISYSPHSPRVTGFWSPYHPYGHMDRTNHFFTLFLLIVSDCFTLLISAPSRAIVAPRSVSALSGARTVRTWVVQHSLGTEMLRHLNRSRRCNDAVACRGDMGCTTWDTHTHTHIIYICVYNCMYIYIYIHMYTYTDILIHLYLYLHCMLPYIISMHFHGGVIHCFHRLLWFPAGHHEAADLILKVNGEPVTGDWLVHRIQRSPVYVRDSLRFTEIHWDSLRFTEIHWDSHCQSLPSVQILLLEDTWPVWLGQLVTKAGETVHNKLADAAPWLSCRGTRNQTSAVESGWIIFDLFHWTFLVGNHICCRPNHHQTT